jgi:hypothetical protein
MSSSHLDPTVWQELTPATWKLILTLTHETSRLVAGSFDVGAFWQSVIANPPTQHLAEAMQSMHQLGTDEGRELIVQAAKDQNYELSVSDDVPARQLAVDLWIQSRQPGNERLARVLMLARVAASQAAGSRTYHEYLGRHPLTDSLDKGKLKETVSAWSKQNKKHEAVEIYVFHRGDTHFCEVVRGDPMKRVVEIRDGLPSILDFRPAVSDHISYEPASGRLSIATRSGRLREIYKTLLGTMLAGDASFFTDGNVCNLRPLQEHGKELFTQHRPPEVLRVDVVELHWRRGDRDRVSVYGRNCFDVLEDLGAQLREGFLSEAKLLIYFSGDRQRADVVLKSPNRIDISGSGKHDELIRQLLSEVGIRGAAAGSFASVDTWSLSPYRYSEPQWRQLLRSKFDSGVKDGWLRATELESVTHPDYPAHVGALSVQVLPSGERIGASLVDIPAVRTLSPTDYQGYELDWRAQANAIAQAMSLEGGVLSVEPWLWQLGQLSLGSSNVCVFLASRTPPEHAALTINHHAAGARPTLLIPDDCTCDVGVQIVKVRVPGGPFAEVVQRVVMRLGLQDELSPIHWRSEDLIIDARKGEAWFRRTRLTKLSPGSQPFKFAVSVARGRGRVLNKRELNDQLSPKNNDDYSAKQAKQAFIKAVESSFAAMGLQCPRDAREVFESRGGGYALKGSAFVFPED